MSAVVSAMHRQSAMKEICVFGATGRAGGRLVKAAQSRGVAVTELESPRFIGRKPVVLGAKS